MSARKQTISIANIKKKYKLTDEDIINSGINEEKEKSFYYKPKTYYYVNDIEKIAYKIHSKNTDPAQKSKLLKMLDKHKKTRDIDCYIDRHYKNITDDEFRTVI